MANHNNRQWVDRSGKNAQQKAASKERQANQKARAEQRIQQRRDHHDSLNGGQANNTARK